MTVAARRALAAALALALALTATPVAAQPALDAAPAVEVADLPPLPPAIDDLSSSATVLAAAEAEEDVVVGAAKREQSLGNVASAVTVISADRIRRFGYRTVGEAVAGVAGAYLVDNRLSYSIGIRGLQIPGDFNSRLLVLIDGASVNEAWGAFAGLGFDALVGIDDIARIEVIRGPVSSVYGTNAFFGIINIVTRGASELPRAYARASYNQIAGPITSAGFAVGGIHEQLRGSVQFANRVGETLTLAIPDGERLGADGARSFSAGLVGAWGGSFLQLRAVRARRESPFAPYDVNPLFDPYELTNTQILAEGGHTRELTERLTIAGRAYANIYDYKDTSPAYDPVVTSPLDSTGSARTFGAELRGRAQVAEAIGITAGLEASYNRTRSVAAYRGAPAADAIEVPVNFLLAGAYAEAEAQPTPWLGFTGGVRLDRYDELVSPSPQARSRLSPRAAMFLAKPQAYGLKLLYAEGFRNPSAFEGKFDDGEDFKANPMIDAETIRSVEAVLWAKPRAGLSTRLSGWYWDARDLVEQAPAPPPDESLLQFQNITRYVSAGVEVEASYRSVSGWYAFGGIAYARVGTEDDQGDLVYGTVANAPAITASGGISTPKLFGYAHLSTELNVIGPRPTRPDASGAPSPESPAWAGWNWTIYVPDLRGFDLTLGVRNLVGKRDLLPAPGDYDRTQPDVLTVPRVPGEGRELYVKLGYSY
jgi:outer membrane receptor for ferrienterochelin and colicins